MYHWIEWEECRIWMMVWETIMQRCVISALSPLRRHSLLWLVLIPWRHKFTTSITHLCLMTSSVLSNCGGDKLLISVLTSWFYGGHSFDCKMGTKCLQWQLIIIRDSSYPCVPPTTRTRTHTLEDLRSRSFSFKIWLCWDGLFHISFVSWPEGKACISERNQISIEAGSSEIAHSETWTLKCHELSSFWLPMSRWIGGQVGSRPGAERSLWAKHRIPVAQLLCDLPGRRLTEARSFHQEPLKC